MKNLKNKKFITLITAIIIVISFTLTGLCGCSLLRIGDINGFADQFFKGAFTNDALSANFFFEDSYSALGITPSVTLRTPQSKEDYEASYGAFKTQASLMAVQFKYSKMSDDEKELFDFLQQYFISRSHFKDYYYLQDDFIGGYSGEQANLPIYLTEYKFRNEQDVKDYIALCKLTKDTFPTWVTFEQSRLDNGYGRMKFVLFYAIQQAASFTGAPIITDGESIEEMINCANPNPYDPSFVENPNFVLTNAITKLNESNLTDVQKLNYQTEITDAINNYLIPAYIKLGNDIKDMLKAPGNQSKFATNGLASYGEIGQNYYQTLFKNSTGTDDTVHTAYLNLQAAYNQTIRELEQIRTALSNIGVSNPDEAVLQMFNAENWDLSNLNEVINTLKCQLGNNFPAMAESSGTVQLKQIDQSLSDNYAPAAYFVSALDNNNANEVIIINNWTGTGYLSYDLLSHEGIPGHLYQYNYLKNSDKKNIVKILCPTSYKEGWATYAEHYFAKQYGAVGSRENLLMQYQVKKILAKGYLRTIADILVNFQGYGSVQQRDDGNEIIPNSNTLEYWLENDANINDYPYLLVSYKTDSDNPKLMIANTLTVKNFAEQLATDAIMFPCNSATYYYSYLQVTNIINALKANGLSDYDAHKLYLDSPYSFTQIKSKCGI